MKTFEPKRILWTGSHGFIAGYTIPKLLEQGHTVWGVDNFWKYGKTYREYESHPRFHFFEHDAKDKDFLQSLIEKHRIQLVVAGAAIIGGITMFHELAYDIIAENEKLTCAIFDACIAAHTSKQGFFERLIAVSSSMVYENTTTFPTPEQATSQCPAPNSTYGFQKLAVEYFCQGAWEQFGLPYTIVRPFNAIGIGEKRALVEKDVYSGNIKLAMSHVLPDLVQKIVKGQYPVHVLGSGEQIRHYTYAGDLAEGIVQCMFHPNALGQAFNISTSQGHTVKELAQAVWSFLGKTQELQFVHDEPYHYDVQKRVPDVTKARDVLGVDCTTSLRTALEEIVPWIVEQIHLGTI